MWNAPQLLACHLVKTCFVLFFLYKTSSSSPGCALFSLCIVWKVRVRLVDPFFVPRLADVLPLLLLRVWKGQQGQHGERKEGRLCPALATWLPRGEGGVEGGGEEEGGQREKRDISPPLSLSFFGFLSSTLLFLFPFSPSHLLPGFAFIDFYTPPPCRISGGPAHVKKPHKN